MQSVVGAAETVGEVAQIINTAWDSVNASKLGPIMREVDVPSEDDEKWKQSQERVSILNMCAYETYKMVLSMLLDKYMEESQ